MPCYEYECTKCKLITQKWSSMSEMKREITCECGYVARKIISSTSFKISGYCELNGYSKPSK